MKKGDYCIIIKKKNSKGTWFDGNVGDLCIIDLTEPKLVAGGHYGVTILRNKVFQHIPIECLEGLSEFGKVLYG